MKAPEALYEASGVWFRIIFSYTVDGGRKKWYNCRIK